MKKIFIYSLITLNIFILFISCSGSPIFASIELEVKLKDASMKGNILAICEANNKLYATNGQIYTKESNTTGEWTKIEKPTSGICTGLAVNGSTLFASFIDYNTGKGKGVYTYDGTNWSSPISETEETKVQAIKGSESNIIGLYFNRDVDTNNQTFTESGKIYKVTSSNITKLKDMTTYIAKIKNTDRNATYVHNVNAVGGSYYATNEGIFSTSGSSTTTDRKDIKAIDPTGTYFITGSKVFKRGSWSDATGIDHNIKNPSHAVILNANGKDILLITSARSGYGEILLDSTTFANSKPIEIGSPHSTTPNEKKSQYLGAIGKFTCSTIFAKQIGSNKYFIYVGAHDSNYSRYTGLWGFYNDQQLEWNRE